MKGNRKCVNIKIQNMKDTNPIRSYCIFSAETEEQIKLCDLKFQAQIKEKQLCQLNYGIYYYQYF